MVFCSSIRDDLNMVIDRRWQLTNSAFALFILLFIYYYLLNYTWIFLVSHKWYRLVTCCHVSVLCFWRCRNINSLVTMTRILVVSPHRIFLFSLITTISQAFVFILLFKGKVHEHGKLYRSTYVPRRIKRYNKWFLKFRVPPNTGSRFFLYQHPLILLFKGKGHEHDKYLPFHVCPTKDKCHNTSRLRVSMPWHKIIFEI